MILLVAERFNLPERRRAYSPERWYKLSLRLGAFTHRSPTAEQSRRRLEYLGLRWDASMNLLPPAPQDIPWDSLFALTVAAMHVRLDTRWTTLILVGRKVQRAFGYSWPCTLVSENDILVPHPSGLNRFWNDPRAVEALRDVVHGSCDHHTGAVVADSRPGRVPKESS